MNADKAGAGAARAASVSAPVCLSDDGSDGDKAFLEAFLKNSGFNNIGGNNAGGGLYLNATDKAVWAQVARTVQPLKRQADKQAPAAARRRRGSVDIMAASPGAGAAEAAERTAAMIAAASSGDLDLLSALVSAEKKSRKAAAEAQNPHAKQAKYNSIAEAVSANPQILPDAPAAVAPPTAERGSLAAFDRGEYRRLASGRMPIEGRLDLHGHTQDEAHYALRYFVQNAQTQGRRHLLVITGKGQSLGSEGILQKLVPLWLAAPAMRIYIAAVERAARAHGGSGAFYVRLRRVRS